MVDENLAARLSPLAVVMKRHGQHRFGDSMPNLAGFEEGLADEDRISSTESRS
jgi:hypothetical protein